MIKLETENFSIFEVDPLKLLKQEKESIEPSPPPRFMTVRPDVVEAKVYKLRSGMVKFSVYVTLGYIIESNRKRPIEIFINSKDISNAAEYAVLTRLISAIFRRTNDPRFILEELRSIHDPNGGYHKNGCFIHSFYSEVADVIEQFFYDIGVMESSRDGEVVETISTAILSNGEDYNVMFRICPDCGQKSLKTENGCDLCMSPKCGYSKCDK